MILRLTNKEVEPRMDTVVIKLSELTNRAIHPYIATTNWEKVYCDLSDDTPKGILKQVVYRHKVTPVFDTESENMCIMQLLCEIYPDNAARLRQSFITNKEEYRKIVTELCK